MGNVTQDEIKGRKKLREQNTKIRRKEKKGGKGYEEEMDKQKRRKQRHEQNTREL